MNDATEFGRELIPRIKAGVTAIDAPAGSRRLVRNRSSRSPVALLARDVRDGLDRVAAVLAREAQLVDDGSVSHVHPRVQSQRMDMPHVSQTDAC